MILHIADSSYDIKVSGSFSERLEYYNFWNYPPHSKKKHKKGDF